MAEQVFVLPPHCGSCTLVHWYSGTVGRALSRYLPGNKILKNIPLYSVNMMEDDVNVLCKGIATGNITLENP